MCNVRRGTLFPTLAYDRCIFGADLSLVTSTALGALDIHAWVQLRGDLRPGDQRIHRQLVRRHGLSGGVCGLEMVREKVMWETGERGQSERVEAEEFYARRHDPGEY